MATYTVNTLGWNQTQKNWIHAAAFHLLFEKVLTQKIVKVTNGVIEFNGPEPWPLTDTELKTEIDAQLTVIAANDAAEQAEQTLRDAELRVSDLRNVTLAQVDIAINAIQDLADAKAFLKKLARYLKAKGI
jgi:hypothetical protein